MPRFLCDIFVLAAVGLCAASVASSMGRSACAIAHPGQVAAFSLLHGCAGPTP